MASKKTGRAAGLAALAGLAYMASQNKGGKEGKIAPDRDDADTYTGSRSFKEEDAVESGDFLSRRLKTNPETGAAYSMDNLSPMSSGKSASGSRVAPAKASSSSESSRFAPSGSPVAKAAAGIGNAKPVVAQGGNRSARSDMQDVGGGRSGGRGGPEAGEEVPYTRYAKTPSRDPGGAGKRGGAGSGNMFPSAADESTAMSRIPGSSPTGWQGGEGEQVDSTELGRNVNAALMGRGTGLSTLGKIGAEAATAKGALARAAEAKRIKDAINGGAIGYKKGGTVKKMASGGMTSSVSSASRRGDGIASKGKTRCKIY